MSKVLEIMNKDPFSVNGWCISTNEGYITSVYSKEDVKIYIKEEAINKKEAYKLLEEVKK